MTRRTEPRRDAALRRACLLCTAALLLAGCTGVIDEPLGSDRDATSSSDFDPFDPDAPVDPDAVIEPCISPPCDDPSQQGARPSPSTRFARLTHAQWENTVRDLLYLDAPTGISSTFIGDPSSEGFSTNTEVMRVSPELWEDYQRGAESVASLLAEDPALLARLMPAGAPSAAQDFAGARDAFLTHFGRRVFRRPLTAEQLARYQVLFDEASALLLGDDPFVDGVVLTVRAMLQSPHFVYRAELGDEVIDGTVRLDGYEVATRLSYGLWNTMPDDALLELAGRGGLDDLEGVAQVVKAMIADERARDTVRAFHAELLHTDTWLDIAKDPGRYPEFDPATSGRAMRTELEHFVDHVVFETRGSYGDLLLDPTTFVNQNLADIYGLTGDFAPNEFTRVTLDPTQRAGLLTRLGFLAKNANAFVHDPIHRGVEVAHQIICAPLPSPPDNVTPVPGNGNTMRERVDRHTGLGTCGEGCHSTMINPAGFAFEHYDALGRFQVLDNGFPVDAADSYVLDGERWPYDGAVEFSQVLASSLQVHRCYAGHWLEFVYGRRLTNRDSPLLRGIAAASRDGELSIQDLVTALVLSGAFLERTP